MFTVVQPTCLLGFIFDLVTAMGVMVLWSQKGFWKGPVIQAGPIRTLSENAAGTVGEEQPCCGPSGSGRPGDGRLCVMLMSLCLKP